MNWAQVGWILASSLWLRLAAFWASDAALVDCCWVVAVWSTCLVELEASPVIEIFLLMDSDPIFWLGENTFVIPNPFDCICWLRTVDGVISLLELPDLVMVLLLAEKPLPLENWALFLEMVEALFGELVVEQRSPTTEFILAVTAEDWTFGLCCLDILSPSWTLS